jgi:hypothetical protein
MALLLVSQKGLPTDNSAVGGEQPSAINGKRVRRSTTLNFAARRLPAMSGC